MRKKLLFIFLLTFSLIVGLTIACNAVTLDEIENYDITVNPRNDGTLDMNYHIEWKVLDSTTDKPLTWVNIGIPNKRVDNISALSDTISSINLREQDGGIYVKLDFDRGYYAGEVISFDFSFHQSYMYTLSDNKCSYSFTPGWFNDIEVKNITIRWNDSNVLSSNANAGQSNGYLIWNYSLGKGKKVTAKIEYSKNVFDLNEKKQANNANDISLGIRIFVIFIVFLIIISILSSIFTPRRTYYGGRGYAHYHHHVPPPHHHHHSSCACASRCASSCASRCASSCASSCACACAGGGRAGCSKKDFYGTKLKVHNNKEFLS